MTEAQHELLSNIEWALREADVNVAGACDDATALETLEAYSVPQALIQALTDASEALSEAVSLIEGLLR